jgi:hypothetical protein
MEEIYSPYGVASSRQSSVVRRTTLQVLSCLHSPWFRRSCCRFVLFFYDLEACNLVVTATEVLLPRAVLGKSVSDADRKHWYCL